VEIGDPLYRSFNDKNDSGNLFINMDDTAPVVTFETDAGSDTTITVTGSYLVLKGSTDEFALVEYPMTPSPPRFYLYGLQKDDIDSRMFSPLTGEQLDSKTFELLLPALNGEEVYDIQATDAYGNERSVSTAGLNIVWVNTPPEFGIIWDWGETQTKTAGETFSFDLDASDTEESYEYLEFGLEVTEVNAEVPGLKGYRQMKLDGKRYGGPEDVGEIPYWDGGNSEYEKVEFEWATTENDTGTYTIWFYVRDGFDDYSTGDKQRKKFTLVVE
jgi:hypothetical protein